MQREIARILADLEETLVAAGLSEEEAEELVDSFESAIKELLDESEKTEGG